MTAAGSAGAAGGAAAAAKPSAAVGSAPAPSAGGAPFFVHCTGLGKSGAVAARVAMSLRSVGVRSAFVHGAEWAHGDLGGASSGDIALVFSHSGKTAELVDVAVRLRAKGLLVFAVTGSAESPLAKAATRHFLAPASDELLGVVPSRSIIAQESIGNALIAALVEAVSLTRDAFQLSHPGGAIGGKK